MYCQDYDEQFPFAGREWPAAGFIDVWNGLGPYIKNRETFVCKSDPSPAWNVRWVRINTSRWRKHPLSPSSYYYYYAFYHNFTGNQNAGKPQSMSVAAVTYPAPRRSSSASRGTWTRTQPQRDGALLRGRSRQADRLTPDQRHGAEERSVNLDWTIGGLAGKDLKD